jgi:hypothetical protein
MAAQAATRRTYPDRYATRNYTQLLVCEFNGPRRIAGKLRELGFAQAQPEVFVLPRTNGFLI